MATYEIKTTISTNQVYDMFHNSNYNFSYEAVDKIMELQEEYSENGVIDLDIVALACQYSEYEGLAEFVEDFGELENILEHYDVDSLNDIDSDEIESYLTDNYAIYVLSSGAVLCSE